MTKRPPFRAAFQDFLGATQTTSALVGPLALQATHEIQLTRGPRKLEPLGRRECDGRFSTPPGP